MKFCFVDHAYHLKTKSTVFILDIIKSIGDVDQFYYSPAGENFSDSSLLAKLARISSFGGELFSEDNLIKKLVGSDYDCYIFIQAEHIAERLIGSGIGRFIIVPMYDGVSWRPNEYWKLFLDAQFISFSRTHHELLRSVECKSAHFRYFPPVAADLPARDATSRTGFFWERRPDLRLNLPVVVGLAERLGIKRLHAHIAPDFNETRPRDKAQIEMMSQLLDITTSEWFEKRSDFVACASNDLFYFAPRASEGIGMAVLEAMGRGQIVVSPDVPTMNEYISHGVTGILYDLEKPEIDIDLSDERLAHISHAARNKSLFARHEWEKDIVRLQSILLDDGRRWSTSDHSADFVNKLRASAQAKVWSIPSLDGQGNSSESSASQGSKA